MQTGSASARTTDPRSRWGSSVDASSLRADTYRTEGVESIATITELRAETSGIVAHARSSGDGVLIQKNDEPPAVLLSYDRYRELVEEGGRGRPTRTRAQELFAPL